MQKAAETIHVSGWKYEHFEDQPAMYFLVVLGMNSNLASRNAGTELCMSRNGDQAGCICNFSVKTLLAIFSLSTWTADDNCNLVQVADPFIPLQFCDDSYIADSVAGSFGTFSLKQHISACSVAFVYKIDGLQPVCFVMVNLSFWYCLPGCFFLMIQQS